ncbi:MAG: hypothetical protein PQJ46_11045 [Spirochaetales bacterium]|nr:hypothetical protein [Spirochaetales bacterium]
MSLNQGQARLRDLSITVVLALVLSQFGLTLFLFTVPLYALYYSKGVRDLLIATGSTIVLMFLITIWKTSSVADTDLKEALIIIEMLIPVLLMLGMFFIIDIIPALSGLRRLYRLFIATGVAVIVAIPVFRILINNNNFTDVIESQMNMLAGVMTGSNDSSFESEVVQSYLGEEGFWGYMKRFYMKSAAALYFLLLMIVTRISDMLLFRFKQQPLLMLIDFTVPEILLWPTLLVSLGMLVEVFNLVSLGAVSPFIWNIGFILLFLYGLQGFAILRTVFLKFKLPMSLRFMIEMIIIMILLIPGINYIVIIGLPVFGASETWIKLRKSIRST